MTIGREPCSFIAAMSTKAHPLEVVV